jgi:uncharacterized protein with von Willebrand factor type A (vWA) domain
MEDAPLAAGDRLLGMLLQLFDRLRAAGVDVSMVEVLDAASALTQLDLADRPLLRAGLQATLVKRPEDRELFFRLFERCFPLRVVGSHDAATRTGAEREAELTVQPHPPVPPADEVATATSASWSTALLDALRTGDDDALRLLVVAAVDLHAGDLDEQGSERSLVYRILRALDLSNLLVAAMREVRAEHAAADAFTLRQQRDELAARIERLRRMVAEEVHRRMVTSTPGVGLVAPRRLEDLDVLEATTTELRAMRAAVRPLARKLASRISERRRRHRRGRLDVRRTVRRSMDRGGVPFDPAFRLRRPSKPTVVVLCDVSGSVAEFAHFTLMLLGALQAELSGLRTFVFVDGIAEVTHLLDSADRALDPRLLVTLPGVVAGDGHSDYGQVFAGFLDRHAGVVGPATTLLVTGDARTNYRSPGLAAFRELCRRARRVYWLDPEPAGAWDADDSALPLYRETCTAVFEVRSLTQLTDAVAQIV